MIFGTLWYMVEEMNNYGSFEVITLNINEDEEEGTAMIRNTENRVESKWYWEKDLELWMKED